MEIVLRAAAVCVTGSILAITLRKITPELSLLLSLTAGLLAAGFCIRIIGELSGLFRSVAEDCALSPVLLTPVLKCVGISLVTELSCQLCRDAQQGAAASFMELCGTLCALCAAMPLIRSLMGVISAMV